MLLYNIGVWCYYALIRVAALFRHKARLWVKGRRGIFEHIGQTLQHKIRPGDRVIWMHCASLGEFEQGRPVLEKLAGKGFSVVLTFFSPSGYEMRKDYEHAAAVFYLPIDTPANAERFLQLVKPEAALFVKYEFWLNYLAALRRRQIDTYLVSGVFRPRQHFFKWYGKNFLHAIRHFKTLFVQDENSLHLLQRHGLANAVVAGDTRFDRVMEIVARIKSFSAIERFTGKARVIMAGSTWPKDEEMILSVFRQLKTADPSLKLILVPHEIDAAALARTNQKLEASGLRFGSFVKNNYEGADILLVDTIGMLSQLYQYAGVAYVGGGFNDGIHNILEVLAHGVPVAFGPNYHKFVEAREAAKTGIGRPVKESMELKSFFEEILYRVGHADSMRVQIKEWMKGKTGATEKICAALS
jgi:3-deoxy-D-manno-octulosonic-acid transferase